MGRGKSESCGALGFVAETRFAAASARCIRPEGDAVAAGQRHRVIGGRVLASIGRFAGLRCFATARGGDSPRLQSHTSILCKFVSHFSRLLFRNAQFRGGITPPSSPPARRYAGTSARWTAHRSPAQTEELPIASSALPREQLPASISAIFGRKFLVSGFDVRIGGSLPVSLPDIVKTLGFLPSLRGDFSQVVKT